MNSTHQLFSKYDRPVPRYTSYPSVPYWQDNLTSEKWTENLARGLEQIPELAIYTHIPFCESLCTYCGCHQIITKNHQRGVDYLELVLRELELYKKQVPQLRQSQLSEFHLGGGTPTFLQTESLKKLIDQVMNSFYVDAKRFKGSIEVDPRTVKLEQLEIVRQMGFNRLSLGVQDFNHSVQKLINRIQPFEMVEKVTQYSRQIGFESVNFDLIYGLPTQSTDDIHRTIDLTLNLKPERIALYSMALVPWMKPAQRLFKDEDLPKGSAKRALYETARERLLDSGYHEIGMDHFALDCDDLYKASQNKTLHRNFMGYTVSTTPTLLGLGLSSISQNAFSYHQNEKDMKAYKEKILAGNLATLRGHNLSQEDLLRAKQIREIMTRLHTSFSEDNEAHEKEKILSTMIEDGMIQIKDKELIVTEKGRPFLRNICLAFDEHMNKTQQQSLMFSKL